MKIEALDTSRYYSLACFLEEQVHGSFSKEAWLDRFRIFWDENEAFKNNNFARGWLLLTEKQEIKGFFGNLPVYYTIRGERQTFCAGTTWYVDKPYRSKSLSLLQNFLKQQFVLLDTTPNLEAEVILKRCGFSLFFPQWFSKDYLLSGNEFLFVLFFLKKIFKRNPLFKLLYLFFPFIVFLLWSHKKIFGLKRECQVYSCEQINSFSDEYDAWCKEINKKFHILALRDARRLNWFYFSSESLKELRVVLEVRKNKKLLGYASFKIMDCDSWKKKTCFFEMIDLFSLGESEDFYRCVLRKILALANKSKKKVVGIRVNAFNKAIEDYLKKSGFFAFKGRFKILYRDSNQQIGKEEFYTTALDGDRCFFP